MVDRPILFSSAMVCALLDGRKTQTRRIIKFPGVEKVIDFELVGTELPSGVPVFEMKGADGRHMMRPAGKDVMSPHYSPRFAKGDRLFVRETYSFDHRWTGLKPSEVQWHEPVWYWADGNPSDGDWTKPIPAIHQPRWASRLTLTVTDVRVQRLQEISEADAEAEGCPECSQCHGVGWINSGPDGGWQCTAKGCGDPYVEQYARLWDHINGAGSWDANPWVCAISFEVHRRNIDEVAK